MKSFESLIGASTRATIHQNHQVKQLISQIVPAKTLIHIQFCRIQAGRMYISVDSSAWIARLRFCDRQIIDFLGRHGFAVDSISYHVAPENEPPQRKSLRKAIKPAIHTVRSLEAAAEQTKDLNDDSRDVLRRELLNLAKNLRHHPGR